MTPLSTAPPQAPWSLVLTAGGVLLLLVVLLGLYVRTWRWKP